jgi:pimeloyl-ACP methyl ester carboxylesterase
MPTLHLRGIDLHYADTGPAASSTPPVVFLNGLAGDHLYWMGQVRALAKRFRCLALDNRDSGQSTYPTTPYTLADLADDVAGLLAALEQPAAHVVGLSLGGMIAQELALRHPQRVRSLFLVGTLARCDGWFNATLDAFALIRRQVPDTGAFFDALLPWLVSYRYFESPGRVEWLKALLHGNPHAQRLDGFFRQFDAIRKHDTTGRLKEVRCPALVAVGEDDMIVPPRYARQLAGLLPQARLEVLPEVGHAPPIEAPRPFNRLLDDFLARTS